MKTLTIREAREGLSHPEKMFAEDEEVLALLHKYRIEKVLVVDDAFRLRGLITVKDILKSTEYPNACKDAHGSLRVGAAIGVGPGTEERAALLVEAGVVTHWVRDAAMPTVRKLRIVSRQQQLIRLDFEDAPTHEVLNSVTRQYRDLFIQSVQA